MRDHDLEGRVKIEQTDYRDLQGRFDKISSVGMFEHVGSRQLSEYFRKIHSLLNDGGLFLNRGIVRPETVSVGPATFFLQKTFFPEADWYTLRTQYVRRSWRVSKFSKWKTCVEITRSLAGPGCPGSSRTLRIAGLLQAMLRIGLGCCIWLLPR